MSDAGFKAAPAHYASQERETIDYIRDILGDQGFIAFCEGNVLKYEDRCGLKGDDAAALEDRNKAEWYAQMANHVRSPAYVEDPRSGRPDFTPYVRWG